MNSNVKKNLTIIITSLLSALLMGFLSLFFLIPLQFITSKYGKNYFLLAAGLSYIIGIIFLNLQGIRIDMLTPLGLIGGLFVLNSPQIRELSIPSWLRCVIGGFLSILGLITMFSTTGNQGLITEYIEMINANTEFSELFSSFMPGMGLEEGVTFLLGLLFRLALFNSTFILLLAYGVGRIFAEGHRSIFRALEYFRLPMEFIWVLIISLIALMLGETLDFPFFIYGGWNIFLLSTLLYFIQGLAIIIQFIRNRFLKKGRYIALLTIGMFLPGLNVIIFTTLTILGVSSIWISYSAKGKEGGNNESHS